MQNPRRCSYEDKHLKYSKGHIPIVNATDDHYPPLRLGAVVGNGRHDIRSLLIELARGVRCLGPWDREELEKWHREEQFIDDLYSGTKTF